jgi:hypothetical protein
MHIITVCVCECARERSSAAHAGVCMLVCVYLDPGAAVQGLTLSVGPMYVKCVFVCLYTRMWGVWRVREEVGRCGEWGGVVCRMVDFACVDSAL